MAQYGGVAGMPPDAKAQAESLYRDIMAEPVPTAQSVVDNRQTLRDLLRNNGGKIANLKPEDRARAQEAYDHINWAGADTIAAANQLPGLKNSPTYPVGAGKGLMPDYGIGDIGNGGVQPPKDEFVPPASGAPSFMGSAFNSIAGAVPTSLAPAVGYPDGGGGKSITNYGGYQLPTAPGGMEMQGIPEGKSAVAYPNSSPNFELPSIPQRPGGPYAVPTYAPQKTQLEEQAYQNAVNQYNQTVQGITNSHIPTREKVAMLAQASHQFQGFLQHGAGAEQMGRIHSQDRAEALSQGEFLRLQKLKGALGSVDAALHEGRITPGEAADFKLRIQSGIDPLESRMQATQLQAKQMQIQQMQEQAATQKSIEIQNQQFEVEAKNKGIGVLKRINPRTGAIDVLFQDPKNGTWYDPWDGQNAAAMGTEDKAFDMEVKHYETQHKAWTLASEAYHRAWAKERAAVEKENKEQAADPENKKSIRLATDEELDAAADRRVRIPRPGPEPTMPQRRTQQPPPNPSLAGGGGTVGQPGGMAPQPQLAPPPMRPRGSDEPVADPVTMGKPFPVGDASKMTPLQQGIIMALRNKLEAIEARPDLRPAEKKEVVDAVHGSHDLLARYGWLVDSQGRLNPTLSEDDKAKFERYKKVLGSIPSAIPRRPGIDEGIKGAMDRAREGPKNSLGFSPGVVPLGR